MQRFPFVVQITVREYFVRVPGKYFLPLVHNVRSIGNCNHCNGISANS